MKHYFMSKDDVLKVTGSTPEGLTSAEAEQRLGKYGRNQLEEGKRQHFSSESLLRFPIRWYLY